jgi:hypothetical protein
LEGFVRGAGTSAARVDATRFAPIADAPPAARSFLREIRDFLLMATSDLEPCEEKILHRAEATVGPGEHARARELRVQFNHF